MKTAACARSYVMRILGIHPIPEKNVLYFECPNADDHEWVNWESPDGLIIPMHRKGRFNPQTKPKDNRCPVCKEEVKEHVRGSRVYRFASEILPGESGDVSEDGTSAEVKNTQYPEFKKWLPPFLIKKDITTRNLSQIIADPYGGRDIIVEYVGYKQSVKSVAGQQRLSIWLDEESPIDFYEEQLPRLMKEGGDLLKSLTPAEFITWTYDKLFSNAHIYYRTKAICNFLKKTENTDLEQIEITDSDRSIAVIQAATDDNPTLSKKDIDELLGEIDDPDVYAIRRFGIFKQVSGRIFKDFDHRIHRISSNKYFPDGMFHDWVHARGIDYHPQTPWACGMISLSPTNEAFIWGEFNPSPEKLTTREICREVAYMGKDYKFRLNKVDPLADATKKDSITIRDDMNRAFHDYTKEDIGTGGFWSTWDTKGERGRDEIKKRLKNAKKVGKPFNNLTIEKNGRKIYLPTIWILDTCRLSAKSMSSWRWDDWANSKIALTKEAPNKPQQRWSHFNMVWEAIFKDSAFRPKRDDYNRNINKRPSYFQGRA